MNVWSSVIPGRRSRPAPLLPGRDVLRDRGQHARYHARKEGLTKEMDAREVARQAIEEVVHRETRAWDRQDAVALVDLFHPDMVWPWPPTERDHDPATWVFVMGRFDRERWTRSWQELFATHRLIHNRREIRQIVETAEADGGFAVVDVDTLWCQFAASWDHLFCRGMGPGRRGKTTCG